MKHIQKFERFDLTQSDNNLQNENCCYSCDECDNIWKSEVECDCCKFCDSNEIEELQENEWNELNKMRLENN
jgi:hypothetical protein